MRLVAQTVKRLPAKQETWVRSLSREDPLEKEMATHSGILARRIPMDRGAWRAAVRGVKKSWTQMSDRHPNKIGGGQLPLPKPIPKHPLQFETGNVLRWCFLQSAQRYSSLFK